MVKKIAESSVDLLPNMSDARIKSVMSRVDKIAQNSNAGISRIVNARGGMLGIGGSLLGISFNPLTLAIKAVVDIFTTLIKTVEKLNNKFQNLNNPLMNEAQKQNKALAIMGGNTEENNIMYRVLESQGINASGLYKNLNQKIELGDLQQYKGLSKNDLITNLVEEARNKGVIRGAKYLEEMELSDLEPLLYSRSSIGDLKKDVITQAKKNGDDLQGNNVFYNARKGEQQLAIDFTRTSDQSTKIKQIVVDADNTVKDNELSVTKRQYEELADTISKTTIVLSNFNKTLNESSFTLWDKIVNGLKDAGNYLTTKNLWKDTGDYLTSKNIIGDIGGFAKNTYSGYQSFIGNHNIDEGKKD